MPSTNEATLAVGIEAQRAALEAVLRSRTFAKNPRLTALLEYLCIRRFLGAAESIKEYNIATDVFGRPPDFDQSQDAIVRVEMHRLRKKLAEFYASEGEREPVEIVIHTGRYLPEFVPRQSPAAIIEVAPAEDLPAPASWQVEAPAPRRTPQRLVWLVAGLLAAACLMVLGVFWPGRPMKRTAPVGRGTAELAAITAPVSEGVHILCGSSKSALRDRQGNVWAADAYYSGGSAVVMADQPIYRTRDGFLFRSARTGEFSYKIPLKPGVYELRLYFADQAYSPGVALDGGENTRVFNVTSNGDTLLRDFDIIADAGPNTADIRVFKDIQPASDGLLHLSFVKALGEPLVNAIEIVPGVPHHLRPIRIVTQDRTITDRSGLTWHADDYFLNGRGIARPSMVPGKDDPQIYECERYGNFSYAIPVSQGRYRLTLHFAESYWGPNAPGGGGPGTRIFNVYCNGVALLSNFDMLKEASPRTQIVKVFDNLQPNAQGKLLLSFVPVNNYANISAIEVSDEPEARE